MIPIIIFTVIVLILNDVQGAEQISRNAPHLATEYVMEVEKISNKYCAEYKIPCNIFKAILAVESNYSVEAFNKKTKDYGIGQINEKTIQSLKLDKVRLLTDLDYSIKKSAQILKYFYVRFHTKEEHWYVRYNVGTRTKALERPAAKQYLKKVQERM